VIEPLLIIERLAVEPALDGVQAIALTSANAVPALDDACMALPLFAVGRASAAAARRAGHPRVEQSDGDGASLARLIAARRAPAHGAILHLSGAEVRPGLAEGLAEGGFAVVRQAVYRARAAERLSGPAEAALRAGVDAVLLFSPRTAGIFSGLIAVHGLEGCLADTEALCLSAAVATACRDLTWRGVQVAARPDQSALVELLEAADRRC
jgi:uroporphyrinogen-III synthase